jgi:hypothetical protein
MGKEKKEKEEKMAKKAVLLLIFSFLEKNVKDGIIGFNKSHEYINQENMKLLFFIYKKMKRLSPNFAKPKIQKYLMKKIDSKKTFKVELLNVTILLLYFYRLSDFKKDIIPLSIKEAKNLLNNIKETVNEDEKEVAKRFFVALFPDDEGFIEYIYIKLSSPHPFV